MSSNLIVSDVFVLFSALCFESFDIQPGYMSRAWVKQDLIVLKLTSSRIYEPLKQQTGFIYDKGPFN